MIDSRILIGLIAMMIAVSGVVYIGITEVDRQEEFKAAFQGRSIESGATIFTEFCSECHGLKGQGSARAPALNTRQFFDNRLDEIGYAGSLEAYVRLTVAGGRPVKSDSSYPQNMPTWSVDFGGPLRNDQVDNVVDYIMNWEEDAPEVDTGAPLEPAGDTPEVRGEDLFKNLVGCVGCHVVAGEGGEVGPELTNLYSEKGEDYVRESILNPNVVIAEGYTAGIMPQTFATQLSDENLNDIVAYLASVAN